MNSKCYWMFTTEYYNGLFICLTIFIYLIKTTASKNVQTGCLKLLKAFPKFDYEKQIISMVGAMNHQLSTWTAFPEDPRLSPSTHMVTNHPL